MTRGSLLLLCSAQVAPTASTAPPPMEASTASAAAAAPGAAGASLTCSTLLHLMRISPRVPARTPSMYSSLLVSGEMVSGVVGWVGGGVRMSVRARKLSFH